jgi:hypothetical protein
MFPRVSRPICIHGYIDANEHCPGVGSEKAGKSDSCAGCPNQKVCASGEAQKEDPALDEIS